MSAMGQLVFVVQEAIESGRGRGEVTKMLMREYGLRVQDAIRMVRTVERELERFEKEAF
jgi:hypothetical protein